MPHLWTSIDLSMVGSGGISGLGLMGISIDKFDTDLFGQFQSDLLAGGGSQLGLAFGNNLNIIFDFGDGDTFLFSEISTAHTGQGDGFVDAGLDGFGVGNLDGDIDGGNNGDVVSGFLSDFLAVVVTIRSVAVSLVSGLADSDHLHVGFLLEGDLNSLASGIFVFLLVRVRADLLGDNFDGFSADGSGHGVAEFLINNTLDGQFNIFADGFKSRGANFGNLFDILNGAVVFGLFISVSMAMTIGRGVVSVSRGVMTVSRSRFVVNRLRFVRGGSGFVSRCRGGFVSGVSWGVIVDIPMIVGIILAKS